MVITMKLWSKVAALALFVGSLGIPIGAWAEAPEEGYSAPSSGLVYPAGSASTYDTFDHSDDLPAFMSPKNPGKPKHSENPTDHPGPGPNAQMDLDMTDAQFSVTSHSFQSMGPNDYYPPDPTMAAGPSDILVATNDDFIIYDRDGNQLFRSDINTFLSNNDKIFDPKAVYDPWAGRFFICWVAIDEQSTLATSDSYWVLMFSDNSSAVGGWNWYNLDAQVNGSTANSEWVDYPYIGYDPNAVILTGRMFGWFGSGQDYGKFRFLRKSELFALGGISWWDVWGPGGANPERNIPVAQMQSNPGETYSIATRSGLTNELMLTRWTNTTFTSGGPVGNRQSVPVSAFSTAPGGDQPGGVANLEIVSPRLLNCVYQFGKIFTCHATGFNNGGDILAALKLYRITNAATPVVDWDNIVWAPDLDYSYPNMAVAITSDDAAVSFGRSGDAENPSFRTVGRQDADAGWAGSQLAKAGEGTYSRLFSGRNRWGDYYGSQYDPWDGRSIWFYGEYAEAGNDWGTWVVRRSWKPTPTIAVAAVNAQTTSTVNLTATVTESATPLSGRIVTFFISGTSVGTATTNGSGVATLAYTIPLQTPTARTIRAEIDESTVYSNAAGSNTLTITKANTACFTFDITWPFGASGYLWGWLWRTTDNTVLTGEPILFRVNGVNVGTTNMGAGWTQHPYTVNNAPGVYNYTSEYAGNTFYNSSVSDPEQLTVEKSDTAIVCTNVSGPTSSNQTLVANLKRTSDNDNLNGQLITFKIGATTIGSAFTNASGNAQLAYAIPMGALTTFNYTAEYAGNVLYNASTGTGTITRTARTISGNVFLQDLSFTNVAGADVAFEIVNTTTGVTVLTFNRVLDSPGNWSNATINLPAGNYLLRGKFWHWLSAVRPFTIGAGSTTVTGLNLSLKNGDVNEDNEVGPADFSLLSAAFGSFQGDPTYNAAADLNFDGEVGPADFAILAANFGEFGE